MHLCILHFWSVGSLFPWPEDVYRMLWRWSIVLLMNCIWDRQGISVLLNEIRCIPSIRTPLHGDDLGHRRTKFQTRLFSVCWFELWPASDLISALHPLVFSSSSQFFFLSSCCQELQSLLLAGVYQFSISQALTVSSLLLSSLGIPHFSEF